MQPKLSARSLSAGALALAVLTSVALAIALAVGYVQSAQASELVTRGEADALLFETLDGLRELPSPGSSDLSAVLAQEYPRGVRYIALVDRRGLPIVEAGVAWLAANPPSHPRQIVRRGARARTGGRPLLPGGPPPDRRFGPPPPMAPPGSFRPFGPSPPGPGAMLVIEFEPDAAIAIEHSAILELALGGGALAVLLAMAVLLAILAHHRERLTRSLEHERLLGVVGEMSAVLAHEIRNPLASLKGHAQLLLEALPDEHREHARATRVVGEAMRLETLTNDLLELVRTGSITRGPCDPVAVLREAAESMDGAQIEITVTGVPETWRLDAGRMRLVLGNILRNAVQASPAEKPVEARVERAGAEIVYTVRDHGAGFESGSEARAFEPFYTRKTRGVGLGLAVARRIAEMHGGTITARNHPDGGAVVRIAIPEG